MDLSNTSLTDLPAELDEWKTSYDLSCGIFTLDSIDSSFLQEYLSQTMETPKEHIKIRKDLHGKPTLVHDPKAKIVHFNLSHSKNLVAVAVSNTNAIGIDIEFLNPHRDIEKISHRVFHPLEKTLWADCSPNNRISYFYKLWTLKESYAKAVGRGLAIGLHKVLHDKTENMMKFLPSTARHSLTKFPEADCFQCFFPKSKPTHSLAISLLRRPIKQEHGWGK